jgi:sarcosine oxidase
VDVAVIGAGIVGLSTAYALVERGASVTVYERGAPGNGQSGGESRIFRHAHDDPRLVALARESRAGWSDWEQHFGVELVSGDGSVQLGATVERHLALLRDAGVSARAIDGAELAERLPVLAPWRGPAMIDDDGGVIRTTAAIGALASALGDRIVADEVIAVRPSGEVRAGGRATAHDRVVVCAGRGTPELALGAGLALPVHEAAHVRLTYELRGDPPAQLACLQAGDGAYGDPLPGNGRYAVGLEVVDPSELAASADRTNAYVARMLPGLSDEPVESRNCWVTELPWSTDGFAVWERERLLFVAGANLFKHAPALGRALAAAALGDGLRPDLSPQARLGHAG